MIIQKTQHFEPASPGLYKAVCVDFYGKPIKSKFHDEPVDKYWFVFELEQTMPDGRRFIASTPPMTASLFEKSSMGKFLTGWGVPTGEPLDPETLIGRGGLAMIVQREKDGKKYGDVALVTPDPNQPLKPDGAYTRVKDRK